MTHIQHLLVAISLEVPWPNNSHTEYKEERGDPHHLTMSDPYHQEWPAAVVH
jgi:hypothetical protein